MNSHVEICVSDSGRGISEEFLGQVFDRFRQAEGGTTRRSGGLGLGLSIVKHLTELHGGNARVTSDGLDQGATFIISLPLQAVRPEPEELIDDERRASLDVAAKKSDLSGIRVLIVDDEDDSIEIVGRILERKGAEVCTARSMARALEEFTRFSPQVLITDIGMPEHDGYELLARLRELPGGRSVPAVALTAMARNEDRIRALRAGFHLHIVKPVDFTELVAVVQNLAALQTD